VATTRENGAYSASGHPGAVFAGLLSPHQTGSTYWRSATPLRTTRAYDVREALSGAGLTVKPDGLARITEYERAHAHRPHWTSLVPLERDAGDGPQRQRLDAAGWRLNLAEPARGPIILGDIKNTQMGWGVFVPDKHPGG